MVEWKSTISNITDKQFCIFDNKKLKTFEIAQKLNQKFCLIISGFGLLST